jgi:hypothetical protein
MALDVIYGYWVGAEAVRTADMKLIKGERSGSKRALIWQSLKRSIKRAKIDKRERSGSKRVLI